LAEYAHEKIEYSSPIGKENRRLKTESIRQHKVAMLYSFISLEHVVYDILTKLRTANDEDLENYKYSKGNKKAFWNVNSKTNTVQINNINKAIRYLLRRPEMQSTECNCSDLINNAKIESTITNGHKIKNILVHGISAIKNVTLTPTGEKEIEQLEEGKTREIQTMNSKTNYIGETTYFEAIKSLKNDKIFECGHATGDPAHICLDMAVSFSTQIYRIIRTLAKHHKVALNAVFYSKTDEYNLIIATNQEIHNTDRYDEVISFSYNSIIKKYNEGIRIIKSD